MDPCLGNNSLVVKCKADFFVTGFCHLLQTKSLPYIHGFSLHINLHTQTHRERERERQTDRESERERERERKRLRDKHKHNPLTNILKLRNLVEMENCQLNFIEYVE